ncbi:HPr family phosphocarrier protein [Candidatus Competibacter phosphatis]|uniref:HPr family phosphocarrier protein n=1 Tax=Candidatus Competibacter phosphatis TaxID=221280 RepID=A0ABX1TIQ8_9GAMM|nr:HPr family phosphocarrier protein [Candidatus Competibacter phosphatis]NMQ18587.1 HPr family phosphocarrier protein [Candidatus Competibacter phosphatis]
MSYSSDWIHRFDALARLAAPTRHRHDPWKRPEAVGGGGTINDHEFTHLTGQRARRLLQLARLFSTSSPNSSYLTRIFIGDLLSQSIQLEEFLDAYGARNNRRWSRFRSLTATIKLFADVCYELLHIKYSLPSYQLLPIERDFAASTAQSLELTREILATATHGILVQAARLNLPVPVDDTAMEQFVEHLPAGRLARDRAMRKVKSAAETVTQLATAYLNLAAESELLNIVEKTDPAEYSACFPDPVSEDNLRFLKFRFHSLQSLYDTHVSETEVEGLDAGLPILRGHVSVVYHLLEIATQLVHYYERHLNIDTGDSSLRRKPVIALQTLLTMLMNYAIAFAGLYLNQGQSLSYTMLRRYAEVGRVTVPVPCYRGLHVRPATLIAKIVRHYGSDIRMELDDQSYDASLPMDIFRANEKINAKKKALVDSGNRLLSVTGRQPERPTNPNRHPGCGAQAGRTGQALSLSTAAATLERIRSDRDPAGKHHHRNRPFAGHRPDRYQDRPDHCVHR